MCQHFDVDLARNKISVGYNKNAKFPHTSSLKITHFNIIQKHSLLETSYK